MTTWKNAPLLPEPSSEERALNALAGRRWCAHLGWRPARTELVCTACYERMLEDVARVIGNAAHGLRKTETP